MAKTRKIIKIILAFGVTAMILYFLQVNALAAQNYSFDPNYYARKYPDVVAVLGSDPNVLANHYNTSGQYEGRYCCQAEESYYDSIKQMKPKSTPDIVQKAATPTQEPVIKQETPVVTTPIQPVEIVPVYNTYVDVSIDNQTVTYFENGVVKLQSPCVTGLPNGKRDTPKGVFSIKVKQTNRYLVGPTWRSYVNYWMRFTDTACGLHDASWRSSFGGEIYKTNGSHGCVNLPKDFVAQLYNIVSVGTVVYVH